MAKSVLDAPQFQTEAAAFAYVEAPLWPNGPVCPHCGRCGAGSASLTGKTTRPGLYKCYACRKPFTVRMGTIFEASHLALHLWLQVIHLMCASKKGISTRQIQRMLNCCMKTAWFLAIASAKPWPRWRRGPLGGAGKIVEADETYLAKSARPSVPANFRRTTHNDCRQPCRAWRTSARSRSITGAPSGIFPASMCIRKAACIPMARSTTNYRACRAA